MKAYHKGKIMTDKSTKKLGRRDLLKVMTAGAGGLVASAFLPKKWTKPVVDFGVSPVHAAASTLPQLPVGSISGTIFACGQPDAFTSGAVVTVVGLGLTGTSDLNGLYTINNVPTGVQSLSCVNGAFPAAVTPQSVNVLQNTTVTLNFNFNNAC